MKKKINIYSNKIIENFLRSLFDYYDSNFIDLKDINYNLLNTQTNIIIILNGEDEKLINFSNLNTNCLVISNLKNIKLNHYDEAKILHTPVSINNIKNKIKNFIQNLQFNFHDISIHNEKLINIKNNLYSYLTKVELEILIHLIREKQTSKNFIKENILNIKTNIETNSLESHLTRIRKKMNKVNTGIKIQTKNEKLLIKF